MPVLTVYAKDVAGVLADIRLVGKAIGKGAAAADLAASMRAEIDQIAAATASLPHPRTFYELDATKDIYGPADGSFIVEMISLAGGDPITTGSTTVFSIPLERLVGADPEVIVLGDAAYGTTPAMVRARAGLGDDDRGQERRDPPGERHRHHPAGTPARRGPARPGPGHPPRHRPAAGSGREWFRRPVRRRPRHPRPRRPEPWTEREPGVTGRGRHPP